MATGRVHRYNTLGWLGDGRFANVYLAEENFHPYQRVAIKLMKEGLVNDERARQAFAQEKEILERLQNNPSVVKLVGERYSFSGTQRLPYLVLSVPPGKSLIDLIDERGPFGEQEGLQICRQACDVLCDAHAAGIIHNDIKPEHFFWNGRLVSVIDWNVSRFVTPRAGGRARQAWSQEVSTPEADQPRSGLSSIFQKLFGRGRVPGAAPGQAYPAAAAPPPSGRPPSDASEFSGDILEFGTVMYAIFTGWDARDRPAEDPAVRDAPRASITPADTWVEKLDPSFRVTAEGITWPVFFGDYGLRLSTELQDVIRQALHPDEFQRFRSMVDLRSALARCAPYLDDVFMDDDLVGLRQPGAPFAPLAPPEPPTAYPQKPSATSRKVRAHIAKGRSALQAEDYQDAIAEFRQALALDPSNEVATRLLAQAEQLLKGRPVPGSPDSSQQRRVRALVSKGRSALNAGDYEDAIAFFEQALDLDPDNEQARRLLTQARVSRRGRPPRAPAAAVDPRHQYYDPNAKGWLPQGRHALRFNVPYVLEVVQGPRPGLWYPVASDVHLTVGRSFRNDIVIMDRSVSRVHAVLICHGGRCQIVDSGSTNGTFVNGRRVVNRQALGLGDSLILGRVGLVLSASTAPPATRLIQGRG